MLAAVLETMLYCTQAFLLVNNVVFSKQHRVMTDVTILLPRMQVSVAAGCFKVHQLNQA